MKTTWISALGAAALAVGFSATASQAAYFVPGETMGVSLDSPLPEGVFFADLETYGRADRQPDINVGVNIPVIIWSTPFSFYNTRLEFLGALPWAHFDTNIPALSGAANTTGLVTAAFGPILGHDFGNGLTGGISAFVRTPTPSANARVLDNRTVAEGDFRQSLQYTFKGPGPFEGITFIENAGVTTAFGQRSYLFQNDFFGGDFAIEKTFNKFTIGFTGFGNIDLENRPLSGGRQSSVELGGLIAYDFGRFSLTGIVTRTVYTGGPGVSATLAGLGNGGFGYETRGWMRVIVPLYVAPPAPVVTARY